MTNAAVHEICLIAIRLIAFSEFMNLKQEGEGNEG